MPLIEQVKADLRRDEGLRLRAYLCSEKRATIGFGRCIETKGISRAEAEMLLDNDVAEIVADLDRRLPWWRSLSPDQMRALCNMAYQMGISGLLEFRRMLAALQAGDGKKAAACALESKWAKQTPARAQRVATLLERS